MSMAPKREPAVRPIGRNGTDGKTASIQKIAKAIEPRTSFTTGAIAMLKQLRLEEIIVSFIVKTLKKVSSFQFAF